MFYCASCSFVAKSMEERNEHVITVHNEKPSRPKKKYYTTEDEEDEDQTETGENGRRDLLDGVSENTCEICNKQCRSRKILRIHVAQHMNIDPSLLADELEPTDKVASDYDYYFSDDNLDDKYAYTPSQNSRKRLRDGSFDNEEQAPPMKVTRMETALDQNKSYVNDPEVNLLARLKPANKNATVSCGKCDIIFDLPHDLFMHIVTEHTFKEYDAKQQQEKSGLFKENRHVKQVEKGKCNKNFPSKSSVQATEKRNVLARYYSCKICGEVMRKTKQLKKHMRIHSAIKRCGECNYFSRHIMRVVSHQCAMHKEFLRCPNYCLKLFKTKEELAAHRDLVHADKTLYKPDSAADADDSLK